jgi:hemoglobin
MPEQTRSVYEEIGGDTAVLALAHAWHERCLADPIAEHPFSHPGLHPQHTERLAAYWAEALGGPRRYSEEMGDHSFMLWIHSGNGEHQELDDACEACFAQALVDVDVPEQLRPTLIAWFHAATEETSQYPEKQARIPPGLPIPLLDPKQLRP